MYNLSTSDVDSGSTLYDTCQRVVLVLYSVTVGVVHICTATTAIDVAAISIGSTSVNAGVSNTDSTLLNIYNGILEGVAILTTTIDRTLDCRTCFSTGVTNRDMRAVNPRHAVVGVYGRFAFRNSYITT